MKVGIDLGTTYSAVARYDGNTNKPVIIPNAFGKEITPSVICFLDDGDILVGEDAKDMQSNGTGVNAAAFKRNMGDGSIAVSFDGKDYTSEDLSAMLLKHLIENAEKAVGEKITEAVITVPAYFNDFQRTATIRAGESCGVKIPKIINEPCGRHIIRIQARVRQDRDGVRSRRRHLRCHHSEDQQGQHRGHRDRG